MKLFYLSVFWCAAAMAQQNEFTMCMNRNIPLDKFNPIREKIVLIGGYGANFQMLTDKSVPDELEKAAIASYAETYSQCMEANASQRRNIPPDAAALIEANFNALTGLLARLYVGEVTYGQFNNERSQMAQRLRTAIGSIDQREIARAQAANEADMQMRRQAAIQYMLGQQPVYRPAPASPSPAYAPPVTTNCYRFGAQTTCTTR